MCSLPFLEPSPCAACLGSATKDCTMYACVYYSGRSKKYERTCSASRWPSACRCPARCWREAARCQSRGPQPARQLSLLVSLLYALIRVLRLLTSDTTLRNCKANSASIGCGSEVKCRCTRCAGHLCGHMHLNGPVQAVTDLGSRTRDDMTGGRREDWVHGQHDAGRLTQCKGPCVTACCTGGQDV